MCATILLGNPAFFLVFAWTAFTTIFKVTGLTMLSTPFKEIIIIWKLQVHFPVSGSFMYELWARWQSGTQKVYVAGNNPE